MFRSSTALPPAFSSRERANLEAYFARAKAAPSNRSSFAIATAAVLLAIGLLFTMQGPAAADRVPAGAIFASHAANAR